MKEKPTITLHPLDVPTQWLFLTGTTDDQIPRHHAWRMVQSGLPPWYGPGANLYHCALCGQEKVGNSEFIKVWSTLSEHCPGTPTAKEREDVG